VIESYWILLLLGLALASALQLGLWLLQLRTKNATAVDAGWAVSLALLAALYAALGPGELSHRVLIAVTAGIESLRIAWLVARRIGGDEDPRYRDLRARWRERGREQLSFFVFYQAQAVVAWALAVPFLLVSFNRSGSLEPLEWAGAALWLAAVAGETVADLQLARFKADPASKGTTLRSGLWRYSRHPNYFFQWLTWVAYALMALAAPWGWIGLLSPLLILYLILFVTGIPPSEEQALRSRGEDYRRYQRETSAFVPWFPKEASR
jgi:steroid 5-alpha reductase family enzyme